MLGLNIPYFIKAYNTNQCEPCQDNETFNCGSFNLDRYSVYHIDPGFGVNQGYKFWQCVQPNLYNHPQDVLDQGIANIILSSIVYACFVISVGDQKPKDQSLCWCYCRNSKKEVATWPLLFSNCDIISKFFVIWLVTN